MSNQMSDKVLQNGGLAAISNIFYKEVEYSTNCATVSF
jgi:hypothetical protein